MEPLILDLQVDNAQAISSINAFFDIYQQGVDGMAQALSSALGKQNEVKVHLKMEGDQIVSSGVEKISKEVDQVVTAAKIMNGEFGKTPNEVRKSIQILQQIKGDTQKFVGKTKELTPEWRAVSEMIKKAYERLSEFNGEGKKVGNLYNKLVSSQVAADLLMGSFRGLTNAIGAFLAKGSQMEVLFLQLEGFTGGVNEAADAYKEFVAIGQATPFTAAQVATAARTMMGFGIETEQTIVQVEQLAVIAAATGGELGHMARNLGQIQANQRAYTRDLMQFANQGIPIYQELANILDVSTQKVREMVEEGSVGYDEVAQALENMTEKGTAFANIAEQMDQTFSAKMEAMRSAVENFAGRFLAALNALDQALGGPFMGLLEGIVSGLNDLAEKAQFVKENIAVLAPLFAGLAAAITALAIHTIVDNLDDLSKALKLSDIATKGLTFAQNALNVAMAVTKALTGNWHTIVAAAAAAAAVASAASANYANNQAALARAKAKTVEKNEEELSQMEQLKQGYDRMTTTLQEIIDKHVEEIEVIENKIRASERKMNRALEYLKIERDKAIEVINERREAEKDAFEEVKDQHAQRMAQIKEQYETEKREAQEVIDQMRERHAEELGLINAKTPAEEKLLDIRRKELQEKKKSAKIGSKEYWQAQASLDAMDRQVKLEETRKRHKNESKTAEENLKNIEEEERDLTKSEEKRFEKKQETHDKTMEHYDEEEQRANEMYDKQKAKIDEAYNRRTQAAWASANEAIRAIDAEILAFDRLAAAAEAAYARAAAAKAAYQSNPIQQAGDAAFDIATEAAPDWVKEHSKKREPHLFTGGPMSAGQTAVVNELGKEAFLTASGKLSMINSPAWGKWRAPEAGTVIPAHLARQLDIPAGGVNLNKAAGSNARFAARGGGIVSGGDVFNQSVTVQAANPVQAANNLMVEMTRLRRRGIR